MRCEDIIIYDKNGEPLVFEIYLRYITNFSVEEWSAYATSRCRDSVVPIAHANSREELIERLQEITDKWDCHW